LIRESIKRFEDANGKIDRKDDPDSNVKPAKKKKIRTEKFGFFSTSERYYTTVLQNKKSAVTTAFRLSALPTGAGDRT
ncbi:MAG: hypothetical protein KBS59_06120, partial [Clostridiales bacterium]|nr:hypothetical protein [Clostridiales bacterium]